LVHHGEEAGGRRRGQGPGRRIAAFAGVAASIRLRGTTVGNVTARLRIEGDDIVVGLSWWEKLAARRRGVRLPLGAVTRVAEERSWWRAFRGSPHWAVAIPGVLLLGEWRHDVGSDFVDIRPRGPVVVIDTRHRAHVTDPTGREHFSRLALSVPNAHETVRELQARLADA
jgi:hypothetical protein